MRLKPGDPALDFDVVDIFGTRRRLSDYRGRKLFLQFYRYASCPLCNLRINTLIQEYPELQSKGLEFLAFFQSPPESISRYVGRQDAPFPIVADPDHTVYKPYGVESSLAGFLKAGFDPRVFRAVFKKRFAPGKMEGSKTLIPADFLIDGELMIRDAFYGAQIGDHMPIERVRAFADGDFQPSAAAV